MNWVYEYDIAALVVITVVYWVLLQQKNFPTTTNRIFRIILTVAWISTLFDLISIFTIEHAEVVPLWLNVIIQYIYLITFSSCAVFYYAYVLSVTQEHRIITFGRKLLLIILASTNVLLILTSPLTRLVFYFDENLEYCHGPLLYLLYGIGTLFILLGFFDTLKYQKLLSLSQKSAVFFYTFSCILAVILQIFLPGVMLVSFAIAISILLAYLSLQNPDDFVDKKIGTFNRKAFLHMLTSLFNRRDNFTILCLEMGDFPFITQTLGPTATDTIVSEVAKQIRHCCPRNQIYHLQDTRFAVIMRHRDSELDTIVQALYDRFKLPFSIQEIDLNLFPIMCCIDVPENANYIDDVINAIDYSLEEAERTPNKDSLIRVNEAALVKKRREAAISHIIKRAVQNNKIELFYQPVFSVTEQRFTAAEALIRLHDQALGYVSPDEFIPLAEKNGSILKIGEYVADKVCSFLKKEQLWEKGIRSVHVNLSVVQCMQEAFSQQFIDTLERYQLSPSMITLELTEATTVHSTNPFTDNMLRLSKLGTNFSLDRYGIGFSNADKLLSLPFDEIKLAKETMWDAMENEKAEIALKYTVGMLRDLGFHVTSVGIENQEQAERMTLFGCDYLQGYYYSKPLSPEEFIQLLHTK